MTGSFLQHKELFTCLDIVYLFHSYENIRGKMVRGSNMIF